MGGSFYYKREQKHLENKPMVSRFAKNKNIGVETTKPPAKNMEIQPIYYTVIPLTKHWFNPV